MCVHYKTNKELLRQRRLLKQHLEKVKLKNSVEDFDFLVGIEADILATIEEYNGDLELALDEYKETEDENVFYLFVLGFIREIYLSVGKYIHEKYVERYDIRPDGSFELLLLPYISQRTSSVAQNIVNNAKNRESALVITSTEIRVAQSIAERLTMERVQNSGKLLKKFWVGVLDDRIRDNHLEASLTYGRQNAIGFNEMFLVGGEWMMYPRDGRASAKNVVSCRCYVSYVTN